MTYSTQRGRRFCPHIDAITCGRHGYLTCIDCGKEIRDRMRLKTRVRVAWLKFLDRVKPRPGIGGPIPRVVTATPAEAKRIKEIYRMTAESACTCGTLRSNEYRGRDGWWRCFECDGRVEKADA